MRQEVEAEEDTVPVHDSVPLGADGRGLSGPYTIHRVGTCGHEIRGGDGEIICWTPDRARALLLSGLLGHVNR